MKRMIMIVDLKSGAIIARSSDTSTLDVPDDFDPESTTAALDSRSHALYRNTNGKEVSRAVHPRPLSWRVQGEVCLVARQEPARSAAGGYSLCEIEPTPW